MKRIFFVMLAFLALSSVSQAQKSSGDVFIKKFSMGIDVFNDIVMDAPADINFRTINQGANVYGMYTYPVKESNFAFAIGLGLGMHNFYSDGLLNDTSGVSFFSKIPDVAEDGSGAKIDYKKNKVSVTYIDIPAEIRFKTEKGFRIALGMKAGYLINAHTKYKGDDPEDGKSLKIKESNLPNFQTWRFGPTVQIGYKWVCLTGFYSISKVFEENNGPQIYPVSIGLSLRPF